MKWADPLPNSVSHFREEIKTGNWEKRVVDIFLFVLLDLSDMYPWSRSR